MSKSRTWPIVGIVGGVVLLVCAPVVGVVGALVGMTSSFQKIANAGGPPNSQAMVDGVGIAFASAAVSLALFPIGLVLIVLSIIALVRGRRAAQEVQP